TTRPPRPRTTALSLHDALPICPARRRRPDPRGARPVSGVPDIFARAGRSANLLVSGQVGAGKTTLVQEIAQIEAATSGAEVHWRSEEHTSELQSRFDIVCRLLL